MKYATSYVKNARLSGTQGISACSLGGLKPNGRNGDGGRGHRVTILDYPYYGLKAGVLRGYESLRALLDDGAERMKIRDVRAIMGG